MRAKRFFTAVFVAIIAISLLSVSVIAAPPFTDIGDDHPYKNAIDFCQAKGYIVGTSPTTMEPNSYLTRGQLAVIWCRLLEIRDTNHNFVDITPLINYYDNPSIVLNSLGLLKGTSANEFSPAELVSREQLAVLTKNTYNLGVEDPEDYKKYADHNLISEWARDAVSACINAGVFDGLYDGENLKPIEPVTRGEICQLIYNLSKPSHTITVAELTGGTITASQYTARAGKLITLTIVPDEGKRLKAGSLKYNDVTIEGTEFIMPAEDVIITAEFENIPVTLESISVTNLPENTVYTVGETLDLTGLVITATYSDGSSSVVSGYTTDPVEGSVLNTEGTVTITVNYSEDAITKSTSFDIQVNPPATSATLESIAVTTPPIKTTYKVGEALDLTGLVVTATYSDGSTSVVTGFTTDPDNGSALNTEGSVTVTISYAKDDITKSTTFDVQVNPQGTED